MASAYLIVYDPQMPNNALSTKILSAVQGTEAAIRLSETTIAVIFSGGVEKLWKHIEQFVNNKKALVYVLPVAPGWKGHGDARIEEWLNKHLN